MISIFLQTALLFGLIAQTNGQNLARPEVPDKIKAPASEEIILQGHAAGSQIYVCQSGTGNAFAWTLKAPEAELRDEQGKVIIQHYAGPSWKHNDGSSITGKAVARVDSPDADSIPWLLVNVTGHSGEGVLSRVTSVQRIRTKGGQPPPADQCSTATQNHEVKSSYTADYYFYAPGK
ncbi:MAG TPA: DUF3455 domain-containing protein [Candidatus Angelobacter sp.]